MKLSEAIQSYRDWFIAQRNTSWEDYERELSRFHQWLRADRDIADIAAKDLTAFAVERVKAKIIYKDKLTGLYLERTIKESTYLKSLIVLRAFYSYLSTMESYDNISRKAFPDLGAKLTKEVKYLTSQQLDALWQNTRSGLEYTIIHVLLVTGIRQGELRTCKLRDFSEERKELIVTGKGGAQRIVHLTDKCTEVIKNYLNVPHPVRREYLFVTDKGKPLKRYHIVRMFQGLTTRCGFENPVTAHMLRHTTATYLAREGVSSIYIQRLLGHRRAETTARYVHITPEMIQRHESIMSRYEHVPEPEKVPAKRRRRKAADE